MRITKITKKNYEVTECGKLSTTFGRFCEIREKMEAPYGRYKKCFICNKEFKNDDIPYLAIIKNEHNSFICEECSKKVISELESEA
jgi:hypothetical protein